MDDYEAFEREADARALWDAQHRAEFMQGMWYELLRRASPYRQDAQPLTAKDVERFCKDVLLRLYDMPRYGGPAAPRVPPPGDPADMLAEIGRLNQEIYRKDVRIASLLRQIDELRYAREHTLREEKSDAEDA